MKIVVQKVLKSSVEVDNKIVGKIDKGLTLLVGFNNEDTKDVLDKMIDKVINLRIFEDENNIMNKSVLDVNGSILSISQFTLYADTKKGRRPSYINALNGSEAIKLYNEFNNRLSKFIHVEQGIFGEDMKLNILNDGPTTIILESSDYIVKK